MPHFVILYKYYPFMVERAGNTYTPYGEFLPPHPDHRIPANQNRYMITTSYKANRLHGTALARTRVQQALINPNQGEPFMYIPKMNKKILLSAIMTSGLALAITQSAVANPGYRGGNPDCQVRMQGTQDQVTRKAKEKLFSETTEIRKQMAQKRAAMRATMQAETPDVNKVAVLAGELFDLREQMRLKAQELGLPLYAGMGKHCGLGPDGHGPKMHGKGLYGQQL